MKKIGFTTGVMYKQINPVSIDMIRLLADISTDVIEISLIGEENITLNNAMLDELQRFQNISIHAPCANITYSDNTESFVRLLTLKNIYKKIDIKRIVFHPDTIHDWSLFSEIKLPIAIENMDNTKTFGKRIEDLELTFSHIDCGFVLDINHAYTVDPSMKLARDLIHVFGDRLVEIHASGYTNYHEPLYQTKQTELLDEIRNLDVPIILEAVFEKVEDIQKEYDFVQNYLS